jgi:predicted ATPase/DNA-binding SARP family transcriptional activator
MARLALALLGTLQVTLDDQPVTGFATDKVRALLAYLALEARPHRREVLAELLWPGQPGTAARKSLRVALTTLRQAIDDQNANPPFLLITRETVQLNPAGDATLDVTSFIELLGHRECHAHPPGGLCAKCVTRLSEATRLYRGELLQQVVVRDSVMFEEWLTLSRERLHRQALDALGRLAAYHEMRGEDEHARRYAWRTLALEAWDEAAHRCLIRVLARNGQRTAALAQYERYRKVLADELGVEPSVETTALYEQLRGGALAPADGARAYSDIFQSASDGRPASTAGATTASAPTIDHASPNNLPEPPTPLIGRERELAELGALLRRPEVRLITLTGVGGSGKTRLALELAAALQDVFPDGVFLVELAPVHEAQLVGATIATTLGLKDAGAQPLPERLSAHLHHRRLLLVLDNFEHVVEVAPLLATLLGACRSLKMLITSRAALRLRGEHEVEVAPLAVPDLQRPPGLDPDAQTAAVSLFVARARDVRPDFLMTPENAASIHEICVRLDGLPLALELAAARIKLLSPQVLLARLGSRLQLLTGGARDLPARQQTLRDTITWSYNLLTPTTQRLFQRLAVFVGGWTLEAAAAVCDEDGDLGLDVLDGMQALVNQSLVRQEQGLDGKPRFTMLETIREYALEQLGISGEQDLLGQRHATFFLTLAEAAHRPQEVTWLDRLEAEHANLRAALAWSRTEAGGETGLRLAVALWAFYSARGHLSEGRGWLIAAVAQSQASGSSGQNTRQHLLLRAQALDCIGAVASWQGDLAASQSALEAGLALSRELERSEEIIGTLSKLGMLSQMQGDYERAGALLEQSLTLAKQVGDTHGISWCHLFQGILVYSQGNVGRASELWEESLIEFQGTNDIWGIVSVHSYLGMVMLDQGNHVQAQAHLSESLTRLWEYGDRWQLAFGLELCARLAALAGRQEQGQPPGLRATRLFGAAEALRERLGAPRMSFQEPSYQRGVDAARAQLGQATFAVAWEAGRAMLPEQALAEALATTEPAAEECDTAAM